MKKFLTTILAFVYLSTSMGATIHLHYCMGKLASWGLIDHEGKNCAQCGMVKKDFAPQCVAGKMNCCKDEHKLVKTDTDQKLSSSEFSKYNRLSQDIALNELATQTIKVFSVAVEYPGSHAPPLSDKTSLFVLYCNFRI